MWWRFRRALVLGFAFGLALTAPWGISFIDPASRVDAAALVAWVGAANVAAGVLGWFCFLRRPMAWPRRFVVGLFGTFAAEAMVLVTLPFFRPVTGAGPDAGFVLAMGAMLVMGAYGAIPAGCVAVLVGRLLPRSDRAARPAQRSATVQALPHALETAIVVGIVFALPGMRFATPNAWAPVYLALAGGLSSGLIWRATFHGGEGVDWPGACLAAIVTVPSLFILAAPMLVIDQRGLGDSLVTFVPACMSSAVQETAVNAQWIFPPVVLLTLLRAARVRRSRRVSGLGGAS